MAKSQELENFGHMVEKIIFDDDELERLKIAIKNFTERKISAKDLKRLLLQCRGRMVEEMTNFGFFYAQKKPANLSQAINSKQQTSSSNEVESQLRKEIEEKNELLETVAKRISGLVFKGNNEESGLIEDQDQEPISIEDVKEEFERCLTQIGAEQWIEMCYYDDYKFFVKLYPKLEALYEERFYESEKNTSNATEGKEIMANKMVKLGFPKDIETILINYISIRNNFNHSMYDISPSNLELAREVFVNIFVYLIISSLDSKLLLNNREMFFSCLKDFFSNQLNDNLIFHEKLLERFKTVFYA